MTNGSSGCDVCAAIETELIIEPGNRALVPTGLCLEIPEGMRYRFDPEAGWPLSSVLLF
jgi:dUTP pyrophosphatase